MTGPAGAHLAVEAAISLIEAEDRPTVEANWRPPQLIHGGTGRGPNQLAAALGPFLRVHSAGPASWQTFCR